MIAKVSYCFALDKAKGFCVILCQKDSIAPLLNPSCNKNNIACGYVNLKSNIEEFQRSEALFSVGTQVHLNELQGDGITQNLKGEKT